MTSWSDIDLRRRRNGLSRAEFCRRAGICQSTVYYGLSRGGSPTKPILAAVLAVLDKAEAEQEQPA